MAGRPQARSPRREYARVNQFRVPKVLPKGIRSLIRLGKPGQFLSAEKAFRLHDLLTTFADQLAKQTAKPYDRMEAARRPETRQKWQREFFKIQSERNAAIEGRALLEKSAGTEPLPPLARRDIKPVVKTRKRGPDHIARGEKAREWEIGVDYSEESSGRRHKHGRSSDVSFNARIFHPDDELISERQVRAAMDYFASEGELGYWERGEFVELEADSVRWMTAKKIQRRGSQDDLDNFRAILMTVGDRGLRVGAVKEDDDE